MQTELISNFVFGGPEEWEQDSFFVVGVLYKLAATEQWQLATFGVLGYANFSDILARIEAETKSKVEGIQVEVVKRVGRLDPRTRIVSNLEEALG